MRKLFHRKLLFKWSKASNCIKTNFKTQFWIILSHKEAYMSETLQKLKLEVHNVQELKLSSFSLDELSELNTFFSLIKFNMKLLLKWKSSAPGTFELPRAFTNASLFSTLELDEFELEIKSRIHIVSAWTSNENYSSMLSLQFILKVLIR